MARRFVAVVHCQGDSAFRDDIDPNTLPHDCDAIAGEHPLGVRECRFSCLGGGTCEKVCPEGAIHVDENRVAHVDRERCTGCGVCVHSCPQTIITLMPADDFMWVKCSNHEKVVPAMKKCDSVCVGCKTCERVCPADAIHIDAFLAKIDYQKCLSCGMCAAKCPMGVIHDVNGIVAAD